MVYCSKCGKENEDNVTFCADCGAELYPEPGRRRRRIEKRDECFGLPYGGAIAGIFFGVMIILVGLSTLLGLDIPIGTYAIIIIGILILSGAIYGLTRRRS